MCVDEGTGYGTRGAAGGEAKPHSPPHAISFALARLFQPCCPAPRSFPPVQRVPQVHRVAPRGSGVQLWGFAPFAAHSCGPWAAASAALVV